MRKIVVNGKTIWVKDEGDEVVTPEGAPAEDALPGDGVTAPADVDTEVKNLAATIAKAVAAAIPAKEMEPASAKVARYIDQAGNERLKSILNGKDLFEDRAKLTANEKIVGFYHALVTQDTVAIKALSEGTAADGGYLFPNEFLAELVRPLSEAPRMRSYVRVITMRRDVMDITTLGDGPKVYWTAENAAKTTTTAAFGTKALTARKAAAILYASDELIEDSTEFDVVQLVIQLFAEAIGREEDRVILRGNGTTEPTGIVGNGATPVAAGGNLSFDTLINLVYRLKSKYRPGASFIVHPTNIQELRKLKDTDGQYLWQPSVQAGQPDRILGYPVIESYDMPEASILFGNFKLGYYFGDRKAMTVKVSQDTETAFTKDQTAIRVVMRIAGNVVLPEAIQETNSIP